SAGNYEPAFSPDGKWLAYSSTESSTYQIYVRPYPANASSGKWQISTAPARYPIWSRNGRELFFQGLDGRIMVADYTASGETFVPGRPRRWSDTQIFLTPGFPNLDLAPDGKRFVVFPETNASANVKSSLHVTFLVNFFDELKRRIPSQ